MTHAHLARSATALLAAGAAVLLFPLAAAAQNIAIVNGKSVPKARLDTLVAQVARSGQPVPPEMMGRARDEVVMREIFAQEASRRGLGAAPDFQQRMELARQSILITELFEDFRRKNPVSDAEAQAEYNRVKAAQTGQEYRARHILVEKEEEARALIVQLKAGASFDELAKKHSKDPGSAQNGGDLDFAKADAYVPEFGQALARLKKGETTDTPVKTQFGFHIIRLEDTREAQFPAFDDVKAQLKRGLEQQKLQKFQDDLRRGAKTDYKFSGER
jgi:peptidyl-prolyl cis-trans isomerase C